MRGLIDEHETRRIRRNLLGAWWRDGKVVVTVFGFAVLVVLQLLQIWALRGGP